jgi:uncharacterized protein
MNKSFKKMATQSVDTITQLVKYDNFDIHKLSDNGDSFLSYAVVLQNFPLVKFLIESGADIHHRAACGDNLLTLSIMSENIQITMFLLDLGVNVNNCDNEGNTLLITACKTKNLELVKLIAEKCDMSIFSQVSDKGKTPVEYARSKGLYDILAYLLSKTN